jgi:hypothetical protein
MLGRKQDPVRITAPDNFLPDPFGGAGRFTRAES